MNNQVSLRLLIISSCPEDWGGSEELWAQAVMLLVQLGHRVHICKTNVNRQHPRIRQLLDANCTITDLYQMQPWPIRLRNRLLRLRNRGRYVATQPQQILKRVLQAVQPQLTIVAQGNNFDGTDYADTCRKQGYPYVLIAQKAVDFVFPLDHERSATQAAYQSALRCFFVSQHNLQTTCQQLGMALPQAKVVFNPVNPFLQQAFSSQMLAEPVHDGTYRLACIARLDILDKGQDILLNVLARPKWRARPWQLTLFGAGPHRQAIIDLVHFLKLQDQIHFAGHVPNPALIWQTHHALVLPSRSEGLPLALVETMLCGRPAIATNAGGVAELLIDNVTGFLAATPTTEAVDEALERAWNRRDEWTQLGENAARHVRATVPADAAQLFCKELLQVTETTVLNKPVLV